MKINKAFRYELKPNVEQRIALAKHAGTARFTYNWGLKQRIELYEKEQKSPNAIEQHRILNSLKAHEFPWMYAASKCAPQEALRDLDRAFKNFYRGLKEGNQVGFPKYKKKGIHDSFRLTGTIKIHGQSIQLPRLGVIRLKEKTQVEGRILSTTLSRQADRWYVSITVELEICNPLPVQSEPIGIDLGLTSFVATSGGIKIAGAKPLHKSIKKLRRLSKQHSRKKKGSKNRKRAALKLARHHRRVSNQRIDFHHKLSTKLAKTKSVIIVEDLSVKKMLSTRRRSRSVSDAGWSGFIGMLEYKTQWYGSTLIKAPRYYPSTKTCSNCGYVESGLTLEIREWRCCGCNEKHDRDVNAAINLLKLYTGSSPGIHACEDTSGGGSQKLSSHVSLKHEVKNGIFHKL